MFRLMPDSADSLIRRGRSPLLMGAAFLFGTILGGVAMQVGNSQAAPQTASDEYVFINFMKAPAGGGPAYRQFEQETWRPIAQELVRRGILKRWAAYQVLMPAGEAREYDHITMDVYSSYAATGPSTPEQDRVFQEILAKVQPGVTIAELGRRIAAARTGVRSELLRLVAEAK